MFRKSKAFLAIALVAVLCLVSSITALANLNADYALIGTEANPVQATITKNLRMPEGTITPEVEFEFTATGISVDSLTTQEALDSMPDLNNLTASFTTADQNLLPVNNIISIRKETGNIFQGVRFPHAGIFVYEIRETHNTNPDKTPHEVLMYSNAVYTLTVYVANTEDGRGTFVYGLGTVVTVTDNEGQTQGSKIDPTPGGDGVYYFFSQMVFTNDFVRTNGAVDPEIPDPVTESTLEITKEVSGDFASRDQYFNFNMTLNIPSLVRVVPPYYRAYVVENGAVIDPVNNAASELIGSDAGGDYIMVSTSIETAFHLKHGQRLVFVNTPVGTRYEVTEAATPNYIPSFIITVNNVAGSRVTGTRNTALSTTANAEPRLVGELANRAAFTNTRDLVTPTGLNLNDLPFIGLIAFALGALIIFIVVKSRKRTQHNQ